VLDFRPESLEHTRLPLTFTTDSFEPALPTWFSVWEYADWLRRDLHQRGKLLMGNSTPWSIYAFASLLDAAGTETGWLGSDGSFQPESDDFMCWRRTLSGRKAYLLLLNLDFEKFPHAYVEKYFQRCMFYGIFPSFYSVNAADKPYWEDPRLYNRDRDLFKKYIPAIQHLSAAGWEPVTYAHSADPEIYLERFGREYVTVLNTGTGARESAAVTLDPKRIGAALDGPIVDGLTGAPLPARRDGDKVTVTLPLQAGETRILRLSPAKGAQ